LPHLLLLSAGPAVAEKRIALVVGNSAYQNITRFDNPRNDAVLMADTLSSLGLTLIDGRAQLDLDKADAACSSSQSQSMTFKKEIHA
jgi:uncharacterized caspase-like protein